MSTENIIGALKEKERSDDLHLRPKTKAFRLVRFSRQDHHSPQPKIILWTNRSHAPLTLPLKLLNQMHARHHFRSLSVEDMGSIAAELDDFTLSLCCISIYRQMDLLGKLVELS